MKTQIFKLSICLFLVFFATIITDCTKEAETNNSELAIVDISEESDWDYWVVYKDGDYFYLQESNSRPSTVLMHLKESNTDIPIFFNQEGLPEKVIIGDYIFVFANHSGTYLDLAVILPNGEIETAKHIKTDVDWDQFKKKTSNSIEATSDLIRWAGRAVGAIPCALSVGATVLTSGAALPLAVWKCGNYLLKLSGDIMENEFGITNGYTELVKTWGYVSTITNCGSSLGNPDATVSCLASLASTGLSKLADHVETLEQESNKIHEATTVLSNGLIVYTTLITVFSSNSATVGGKIVTDGVSTVSERGIFWGTSQNPETTGTKLQSGSGTGSFSTNLSGLTPNTTYYVRAYATNSIGIIYGLEESFVTKLANETITDIDGNTYKTVQIGTQRWMAENLKVTRYNDGTSLPYITSASTWAGLTAGGYCDYNNDVNNGQIYGHLYNFYVVTNPKKICPDGWHVPSDEEWKNMEMYLGMTQQQANINYAERGTNEGGKLKEEGTTHWLVPNTGATNSSGFTALPGMYVNERGVYATPAFHGGFWWTSTNGYYRGLHNNLSTIWRFSYPYTGGFSIRCLKD